MLSRTTYSSTNSRGFVLVFTILLILGVTAISVGTIYNGKMDHKSALNYKHRFETFSASDGLMTLLAQELINGNASKYVDSNRTGEIIGKKWKGINGTTIKAFKSAILYRPTPDSILTSDFLGSILDQDNYGLKWTGWIIPPITGMYTFYTWSNEASAFYLSTDNKINNLSTTPVCFLDSSMDRWPDSGQGVSKPIPLVAGRRYYFQYYQTEGEGFDIGMVGWSGPENLNERPISGAFLSKFPTDTASTATQMVGTLPVQFQVLAAGQDQYQIFTEASETHPGDLADTVFRTPLHQTLSFQGKAEAPEMKISMPVIHYDYKADGTNPDFNTDPGLKIGIRPGMVKNTLSTYVATDADYFGRTEIPKPSFNKNDWTVSCGLDMWFRDSGPVHNVYKYDDKFTGCQTTRFDPVGEAYKNEKYRASLSFTLDLNQGPDTYVFSRTGIAGEPEYFPLDTIGGVFTEDPVGSGHNFSFCTELHTNFKHQSGLIFNFVGDDDVFVFIGGNLVIDLGGIHPAGEAFVNLDKLKFLKYGNTYDFDFYQCERHEDHSSSRIVTNLYHAPPKGKPVTSWTRDYGGLD